MILNKVSGCEYIQIQNKQEYVIRGMRLFGRTVKFLRQTEIYAQGVHFTLDAPYYPNIDVVHTFNRICLGDRNQWIATFEKTFPEYFSDENHIPLNRMRKKLPLLLSDKCLALLPMSDWAFHYEQWLLEHIATPTEQQTIERKMAVLYPPQEKMISERAVCNKFRDIDQLKILFVGSQMKRKGGVELIRVLDQLRKEKYRFSAVIVGDFELEYGNFKLSTKEKKDIKAIIENSDWLEYHKKATNEEILNLAKAAHIGVLPTMGDTFGFSVLEMQACGCPVVSTDRQALREINHSECGWLLETKSANMIHRDDFAHYSSEEVSQLSEVVQVELYKTLKNILDQPEQIAAKAQKALSRIQNKHDPVQYAAKLQGIYQQAAYMNTKNSG